LIALLPDEPMWEQFRRIVPTDVECIRVTSVVEFSSRLRLEPAWRVLDLSPFMRQPEQVMTETLSANDNPKTIVWTERSVESVKRVLHLARSSPTDVVWRGDDEARMLESALRQRGDVTATGILLHLLAPAMALVRPDVATAILALSGRPVPQRVKQFVADVRLDRRMVERSVQAAGFSGIAGILGVMRIAGTWRDVMDYQSIKDIAVAAGYSSATAYSVDFRRYAGMTPTDARGAMDVWTFATRLRDAISGDRQPPRFLGREGAAVRMSELH
jgi:AraC-like DNA-binding protein